MGEQLGYAGGPCADACDGLFDVCDRGLEALARAEVFGVVVEEGGEVREGLVLLAGPFPALSPEGKSGQVSPRAHQIDRPIAPEGEGSPPADLLRGGEVGGRALRELLPVEREAVRGYELLRDGQIGAFAGCLRRHEVHMLPQIDPEVLTGGEEKREDAARILPTGQLELHAERVLAENRADTPDPDVEILLESAQIGVVVLVVP